MVHCNYWHYWLHNIRSAQPVSQSFDSEASRWSLSSQGISQHFSYALESCCKLEFMSLRSHTLSPHDGDVETDQADPRDDDVEDTVEA